MTTESTDQQLQLPPKPLLMGVSPDKYVPSSPAINQRKFVKNPNCLDDVTDLDGSFSVVSYNILADCHIERWDYSFTEPQYLDQTYRHKLMMKELDYLDGDIVCLQEVGPQYYKDTLSPAMESRGYDCQFEKRTKDYFDEGEATFTKKTKFEVVSTEAISLKDLALREIDPTRLTEQVTCGATNHLDRADIILVSNLTCKKSGKTLIVCNIHVVYDEKAPDVQCVQIASAIKELVLKGSNEHHPHVICGDFNCEPTSAGYKLAKDGYISEDHIRNLQALEIIETTDGASRCLIDHIPKAFQHNFNNLHSAYLDVQGSEPPVTCYSYWYYMVLDYIFFSSNSLVCVGVTEMLDQYQVDNCGGCPNADISSDHLSLKAFFRFPK